MTLLQLGFLLVYLIRAHATDEWPEFYVYETDDANGESLQHNCLYYYVLDNIVIYREPNPRHHQLIPYCIRPAHAHEWLALADLEDDKIKRTHFAELRLNNVTSEQLYRMLAPVDLVERYQMYLEDDLSFNDVYYECPITWFGSRCQYTFSDGDPWDFSDIVGQIFFTKKENWEAKTMTCYTHLQCDRGLPPSCLDWREVCDGIIDCTIGGEDEEHCWQLEINECGENEYRCHNGAQCIPDDFLRDDILNPECQDRTDELVVHRDELSWDVYPRICHRDPAFRCEEVTCRPSKNFRLSTTVACGDGQCFVDNEQPCYNMRNDLLQATMFTVPSDKLQDECWLAMICLTKFESYVKNIACARFCANNVCELAIIRSCPPLLRFPDGPGLFNHVYFIYAINRTITNQFPEYICYNAKICYGIFLCPFSINGSMCCQLRDVSLKENKYFNWKFFLEDVKDIFRLCSMAATQYENELTLYRCENSSEFISKHRLLDGIRNCMNSDDERYENSCALNDRHRFECIGENKCVTSHLIRDGNYDCSGGQDELVSGKKNPKHISFQTICDGFQELTSVEIDGQNETDETECDQWLCNNTYTHCNQVWNCPRGIDEVNCPPSTCPSLEHMCVSPFTYNMTCLPIAQVDNGIVDCLGASDERQLCRKKYPEFDQVRARFRCWNDTMCIYPPQLCDTTNACKYGDDEQFCTDSDQEFGWMCDYDDDRAINRTQVELFLSTLTDHTKKAIVHFKLAPSASNMPTPTHSLLLRKKREIESLSTTSDDNWMWRCNRGLDALIWNGGDLSMQRCLCPPSYYGHLCQYQNQRVSLTIKLRPELGDVRTVFGIAIILVDEHGNINSHEQIEYLSLRDCKAKFSLYLLYSTRAKKANHTYSVRIHVYNKQSLQFRASWNFPLLFSFLPVHRLAILLHIPVHQAEGCLLNCNHGQCLKYENSNGFFCRCDRGWSGSDCTRKRECKCSAESLCVESSICLCKIGRFAPRCFLTRQSCWLGRCHHGGTCVPTDARMAEYNYTCICPDGYHGKRCQIMNSRIDISFHKDVQIPSSILAHMITVRPDEAHVRTTMFKKIAVYENIVTFSTSVQFNIIFIEISKSYYLMTVQEHLQSSANISMQIIPSQRCLPIRELFNTTVFQLHLLRRIKRYHLPCQEHRDLPCFFDDVQMCLCNRDRHANCLEFEHKMTYDCHGSNLCQNGAQCFADDPSCPTTSMCVCAECYYGTRCQFSTKGFVLSLDVILGYHIQSNIAISRQPLVLKVSLALTFIIGILGIVSGLLSILTFQSEKPREVGCGLYLATSSITSIFTMIMFILKFLLLFFSQTASITNRTYLLFNCVSIEFLLQISLNSSNWLNACVAIERAVTVIKGTNFDKKKSKRSAKWVILSLIFLIVVANFQDPIHRRLIDDDGEQRIWCIVNYSSRLQVFDRIMNLIHFFVPFSINLISALIIIITAARQRSITRIKQTYKEHIHEQFHQHKHLLVSPVVLVILSLPRLIISFLSGCMKSARQPWLFLAAYFVSFIPPVLSFVIFVLPSEMYKTEFNNACKRLRRRLQCNV